MVQQNVAGRPVTVFRFPPRTRLKALSHATVSVEVLLYTCSLRYHRKVLLTNFYLNGLFVEFHPNIQKLEPSCAA